MAVKINTSRLWSFITFLLQSILQKVTLVSVISSHEQRVIWESYAPALMNCRNKPTTRLVSPAHPFSICFQANGRKKNSIFMYSHIHMNVLIHSFLVGEQSKCEIIFDYFPLTLILMHSMYVCDVMLG